MRDSFVLYTAYAEHINRLNVEQRGVLLTAIFNYENELDLPSMDGVTEMAFSFIKSQLDRDYEKYLQKIEGRKNAGKASGEARRAKREQNEQVRTKRTNVNSVEQSEQARTKRTDNVNDTDTVNDNKSVKERKEKAKKEKAENPFMQDPVLWDAFNDFAEMRKKKKKPLTDRAIKTLYTAACKITTDARKQAMLLDQATFRSWESVYPLKDDFVEARNYYPEKENITQTEPPETALEIIDGYPVGFAEICKEHGAYYDDDDEVDIRTALQHREWFSAELWDWMHKEYVVG